MVNIHVHSCSHIVCVLKFACMHGLMQCAFSVVECVATVVLLPLYFGTLISNPSL